MTQGVLQSRYQILCESCSGIGTITIGDTDIECQNCNGRGHLIDMDRLDDSYELPATDADWRRIQ